MTSSLRRRALIDIGAVLAVCAILALTVTYALYSVTLNRTAVERGQGIRQHFDQRFQSMARRWEEEAFRAKARLEFFRVLEDSAQRWVRLTALLTAESASPLFSGVVVTDRSGHAVFRSGDTPSIPMMPAGGYPQGTSYQGSAADGIYAVICQPIWLGPDGMGVLHLAIPLDNAFLWQQAYPDTRLFLEWQGEIVASSDGSAAAAPVRLNYEGGVELAEGRFEQRRVALPGNKGNGPTLVARVLVHPPFSLRESVILGIILFAIQALLLLATLSGWLGRLLPRFEQLIRAAGLYAAEGGTSPALDEALEKAGAETRDEIAAVATSMRGMIKSLTVREQARLAAEEKLRESEKLFRDVAEFAGEFVWEIDAQQVLTYVSDGAAKVFGRPVEELRGSSFLSLLPPGEGEQLMKRVRTVAVKSEPFRRFEVAIQRPDGTQRLVSMSGTPVVGDNGRRTGAYRGTAEDITQRKRDEKNLLLAEKVFSNSDQAIMITDAGSTILSVNPAFSEITGYTAAEAIGKRPNAFASGRHDAAFYAAMWSELKRSGAWAGEIWDRRRNGEVYPKWLTINAVQDPASREVTHYVAIFSDITERKENEARIEHLAYHDPLTGLPNRFALQARLAQSLADARRNDQRLALMFIDLDHFKTINDSLGHDVGDQLLVAVARRIRAVLRETDTVARLGGDEFVIVVPGIAAPEDAARVAEKVIEHIGEPLVIAGHALHTSPSLGIGIFPTDGGDADALMKSADTAMYYAKQHGRNTYHFFAADMNATATERLLLETQLRAALDRGEMSLVYQPQVLLATGRVIGVEALVRWNHPERGTVPPAKFIPVAEETGLIVPLGAWVLEEACRQAMAWSAAGLPPLRVAVNLSAHQFRERNLAQRVADILARTGLPADRLELEITESAVMEHAEQTIEILRTLCDLGVRLAIDDFGTGYSSLTYLKRFPISRLKIDRSFVMDLEHDANDVAIARSIVVLAGALGLEVTAEGIETPAQLEMLRGFACVEGQGYLFSRPLAPADLAAFLEPSPLPVGEPPPRHPRLH